MGVSGGGVCLADPLVDGGAGGGDGGGVALGGQGALTLSWEAAPGALRYNIWRGDLDLLHVGQYQHAIQRGLPPGSRCNLHEGEAGPFVSTLDTDGAIGVLGNVYYLVTAEQACQGAQGAISLDGSFGFADRNHDLLDDLGDERPRGLMLEPACDP